jgi:S1-C subfamily serine protease
MEYEAANWAPRRSSVLMWLLVAVGLLLVLRFVWRPGLPFGGRPPAQPRAITARGDLAEDEKSTIELFREAAPSVVYIATAAVRQDMFSLNLFQIPQGTGSGFVWDDQGHIVTNFHVVRGAARFSVRLHDHSTWDATFIGAAPEKDLAVLRITPSAPLRPTPIGTSHDLQVGQKVFAIGNPFGLDQTLTTGVISGLGRQIDSLVDTPIRDVIQTDAAINPGNSGGPLLDSAGRLIGVNTAIYSPSGAYAGVGFAVPVDTVNQIVPDLIRYGKVVRAGLGVEPASRRVAEEWGIEGALVLQVVENSAADKAGIQPTTIDRRGRIRLGDIIIAVGQQAIGNSQDLFSAIEKYKVGDEVTVTVKRGDETLKLPVRLQAL